MPNHRGQAYLEVVSSAFSEVNKLVGDLVDLILAKEARIEELESQVEELENDRLTVAARGEDLDELVEG